MPSIDASKCNGCGLCISACRCKALVLVRGVVQVLEQEDCGWCTECEAVCPAGAIHCPYEIIIEKHLV